MDTSAALCSHRGAAPSAFRPTARGRHERPGEADRPDIRVIACPGGSQAHRPAHARAMLAASRTGSCENTPVRPYRGVSGVPFDLSRRERAGAACAGALLAAVALAAAVL